MWAVIVIFVVMVSLVRLVMCLAMPCKMSKCFGLAIYTIFIHCSVFVDNYYFDMK